MIETMVQIGVTALRSPSGDFLPSVPLYIKSHDAEYISETTGKSMDEGVVLHDISKIFADNFKKYVDGNKKIARDNKNKIKRQLSANSQREV